MLAGFLARDSIRGLQSCELWVSVLIITYARRMAVVWGTPEFTGQLIALLPIAQWLERWCASLAAQVRILAVLSGVSYYKGEPF